MLVLTSAPSARTRKGALLFELLVSTLLATAFLIATLRALSGQSGIVRIADNQVSVETNYWTGESRADDTAGFRMFIPYLKDVQVLDKSPVEYVMEGNKLQGWNKVPRLTVRASDGSSFWFNNIAIHYALRTQDAAMALRDTGPNDGFKGGLINSFARAFLRDEYGRFSPEEIMAPENRRKATEAVQARLNTALAAHGVEVLEISASKPAFDKKYEAVIERRKIAEQDIASLVTGRQLMEDEVVLRHAEISQEKAFTLEKSRGLWEQARQTLTEENRTTTNDLALRLANVTAEKEVELTKERSFWQQELGKLDHEAVKLETGRAERLAKVRRERDLALDVAQAEWQRQLVVLEKAAEALSADRDGRLARLDESHVLASELARAKRKSVRLSVMAGAVAEQHEADTYHADKILSGQLDLAQMQSGAAALRQRYEKEAEGFAALSAALAQQGDLAVRAALIEKLREIQFEIAPYRCEHPFDTAGTKTASR